MGQGTGWLILCGGSDDGFSDPLPVARSDFGGESLRDFPNQSRDSKLDHEPLLLCLISHRDDDRRAQRSGLPHPVCLQVVQGRTALSLQT